MYLYGTALSAIKMTDSVVELFDKSRMFRTMLTTSDVTFVIQYLWIGRRSSGPKPQIYKLSVELTYVIAVY